MSTIKDGGPAFPVQSAADWQAHGMSLRDYMAIHASEADILHQAEVIRTQMVNGILPDGWHIAARYMHADAMLKTREVTA